MMNILDSIYSKVDHDNDDTEDREDFLASAYNALNEDREDLLASVYSDSYNIDDDESDTKTTDIQNRIAKMSVETMKQKLLTYMLQKDSIQHTERRLHRKENVLIENQRKMDELLTTNSNLEKRISVGDVFVYDIKSTSIEDMNQNFMIWTDLIAIESESETINTRILDVLVSFISEFVPKLRVKSRKRHSIKELAGARIIKPEYLEDESSGGIEKIEKAKDLMQATLSSFSAFLVKRDRSLSERLTRESVDKIKNECYTRERVVMAADNHQISLRNIGVLRNMSTINTGMFLPSPYTLKKTMRVIEKVAFSLFGGFVSKCKRFFAFDFKKVITEFIRHKRPGREKVEFVFTSDGTRLGDSRYLTFAGMNDIESENGKLQSRNNCYLLAAYADQETQKNTAQYFGDFYKFIDETRKDGIRIDGDYIELQNTVSGDMKNCWCTVGSGSGSGSHPCQCCNVLKKEYCHYKAYLCDFCRTYASDDRQGCRHMDLELSEAHKISKRLVLSDYEGQTWHDPTKKYLDFDGNGRLKEDYISFLRKAYFHDAAVTEKLSKETVAQLSGRWEHWNRAYRILYFTPNKDSAKSIINATDEMVEMEMRLRYQGDAYKQIIETLSTASPHQSIFSALRSHLKLLMWLERLKHVVNLSPDRERLIEDVINFVPDLLHLSIRVIGKLFRVTLEACILDRGDLTKDEKTKRLNAVVDFINRMVINSVDGSDGVLAIKVNEDSSSSRLSLDSFNVGNSRLVKIFAKMSDVIDICFPTLEERSYRQHYQREAPPEKASTKNSKRKRNKSFEDESQAQNAIAEVPISSNSLLMTTRSNNIGTSFAFRGAAAAAANPIPMAAEPLITVDQPTQDEVCFYVKIKDLMERSNKVLTHIRQREIDASPEALLILQNDIDMMGELYLEAFSGSKITNYLHLLFGGHIRDYLMKYKTLYKYQNQGWEAFNSLVKNFVWRRTQRGGSAGNGKSKSADGNIKVIKSQSIIESLYRWSSRMLMYSLFSNEDLTKIVEKNWNRIDEKIDIGNEIDDYELLD